MRAVIFCDCFEFKNIYRDIPENDADDPDAHALLVNYDCTSHLVLEDVAARRVDVRQKYLGLHGVQKWLQSFDLVIELVIPNGLNRFKKYNKLF